MDKEKVIEKIKIVLIENNITLKDFRKISDILTNKYESQTLNENKNIVKEQKKSVVIIGINPKITTPKPKHPSLKK